ncbi:unnamed protein product [Paramecium sonneborni]|uniref:Uncharacterized protein n=1 Tax=Paramecium sonneborni TaxID=65129 RepID=A0A8S1RJ45_9CILI|nr:unnamed protein product [Paramecium sonneborni]
MMKQFIYKKDSTRFLDEDYEQQQQIAIIFWQIKSLEIQTVIGWKDYKEDFRKVFPSGNNLCPEFHVQMPGLHPHQCVSYDPICIGVNQVETKIDNNVYHLCHPRLKTANMIYDDISVICEPLYQLRIQLQLDGKMIYKCEKITDLCLIKLIYPVSNYRDEEDCLFLQVSLLLKGLWLYQIRI